MSLGHESEETSKKTQYHTHGSLTFFHCSPATSIDEDESEIKDTSDDVDTVKSKIDKVQQLRSDVEGLRKFISDQYAEDIGNNCRMQ